MAIPADLFPSAFGSIGAGRGGFSGKRQGYLLAIISAMLLGFTGIIIRILTAHYHLPTSVLAFWRAALVAQIVITYFTSDQTGMGQITWVPAKVLYCIWLIAGGL